MNNRDLFEKALKETGSIKEAMKLAREVSDFLADPVTKIQTSHEVAVSTPIPPKPIEAKPLKKTIDRSVKRAGKRWTADDYALATTLFNRGDSIAEVAQIMERTISSVRNKLSDGDIRPINDPRDPRRRVGSLRAAITMGKEFSNQHEAQEILVNAPPKKK